MIGRLTGTLVERDGNTGILDVRGVGYEVFSPVHALEAWLRADEDVTVHVSTQVREDAIALYAFPSKVDREAFTQLIAVSGVGPKLALAALDTLELDALHTAVESDDVKSLSRIPGVGKKTAQRIALELKGKLPTRHGAPIGATPAASASTETDTLPAALERLGYKKAEIELVRSKLLDEGVSPDAPIAQRLRAALKILYGNA
ncbi:MAG: Holliday junction branch migration protein RuvA [Deltaproteobacteria bacterium]|nr:MAG: Holliday junction branch migration protein RuvA [Deltaproteobacteria bacterium]